LPPSLQTILGSAPKGDLSFFEATKLAGADAKMRSRGRPQDKDFVPEEEFGRHLRAWFVNIDRVLLPGRACYIRGGDSNVDNYPPALKEAGIHFSQAIIRDKQHPVPTQKDYA
jgi:hypothetical protein